MIGTGTTLAADARGVESLRAAAARDPRAAIKEAAKQFEALFMQELMKSMRQATQTSGVPGDSTTQLGTEMLDTQFAQQMTGLRGGLSEAIARHLERQLGIVPGAAARDVTSGALSLVNPTHSPPMIAQAAQELRRADDATEPHHADQMTRTLNNTLRAQRAVA